MQKLFIGSNHFIFRTFFFSIIFLSTNFCVQAQMKGIKLIKKISEKTVFLPENKRIKVRTIENINITGKYTIIDENTILINNQTVALHSIVKMRKCSKFTQIITPISIGVGLLFVTAGAAGLAEGGYGVLASPLIPIGIPMILIPVFPNKHNNEKWFYKIQN